MVKKKKNARQCKRQGYNPWSKKWQPTCLESSMNRGGAWWVTVHGVSKSQTQLSTHTHAISITLLSLQLIIKYLNHEKKLIVILTYTVNLNVNRYSVLKTFRLYMNNSVLSSILFDLLTMLWKTTIKW